MQNCVMKTCFAEFNSAGMFGKGKQGVEELGQVGLFMQQGFVKFDKLCGALIGEEDQVAASLSRRTQLRYSCSNSVCGHTSHFSHILPWPQQLVSKP